MENVKKSKIIALGKDLLANKISTDFKSKEDMNRKLAEEFATLCYDDSGKFNQHRFNANKDLFFELMEAIVEEKLPVRIEERMAGFADIENVDDGDTIRFKLKKGRKNVRRFVTKVAPAGTYNRVKLSMDYVDMAMEALGGAVYIEFEEWLKGDMGLEDVVTAMVEEISDKVYEEVQLAIQATYSDLPANNKHVASGFVEDEFDRILDTVKAYGRPTIFCTPEFARNILPSADYVSEDSKRAIDQGGFLTIYKGSDVIVMGQSFEDETNTTKVFDPQYAYIVPAGSDEKIVKLGFEGSIHMKDSQREDWSFEVQMYKKFGISILHTNFFGLYRDTSL